MKQIVLIILIIILLFFNIKIYREYFTKYEPDIWNRNKYRRMSHNCYSYMLNDIKPEMTEKCKEVYPNCRQFRPSPGRYANYHDKINGHNTYNSRMKCKYLVPAVLDDNPHVTHIQPDESCPKNNYKGALFVNNNNTYHFYRQDDTGLWSHKDAGYPATNLDASNKIIKDPRHADRKYPNVEYPTFCSFFCIPENHHKNTYMSYN